MRIGSLIPERLRRSARRWVRLSSTPDPGQVVSSLYDPWRPAADPRADERPYYFCDPQTLRQPSTEDGLAVPATDWRQGYYPGDDAGFLLSGKTAADELRSILHQNGVVLSPRDAVLDWGCASGRVIRHFAEEARTAEFWGVDLDARLIAWDKENLSPPFHFLTGSAYPHLPFEDATFALIYAFSVFTHIEHLPDLWLMEMRRMLRPRGLAVFSVHTEETVALMNGDPRGEALRRYLPSGLTPGDIASHQITVVSRSGWQPTLTFYRSDWLWREWGRYFDVVEIRPAPPNSKQPAVVLRKR